jgi:uncharacterized protein YfaT (DUF1175 family)
MSPELEKQLIEKYPKLFSNGQFWGFECGDGWYDILDHLCGAIKEYTYDSDKLTVGQAKEKFGKLRFYLSEEDDVIHGMITLAEYMSGHTCEICGNRGEMRTKGWMVTLCDLHHDERTAKET